MGIIIWGFIFVVSLFALVKGSDWLIEGAENIGLASGLSSFAIGMTVVALGTSLPELVAGLGAVWKGVPEIVSANAIGSNVTNIFLVVGAAAVIGKKMVVNKSLIDLDLPLLAGATALFLVLAWDGDIVFAEAVILLVMYVFYVLYILMYKDERAISERSDFVVEQNRSRKYATLVRDGVFVGVGAVMLALGAHFLIDSITHLSLILGLTAGVITITAVALGTSLPELFVSVKAIRAGKSEAALGNIFGSNVFNVLVVVGVPGLFATIPLGADSMKIGIPFLLLATGLFVISGISRQIHMWEGTFYLALYGVFLAKLFELF